MSLTLTLRPFVCNKTDMARNTFHRSKILMVKLIDQSGEVLLSGCCWLCVAKCNFFAQWFPRTTFPKWKSVKKEKAFYLTMICAILTQVTTLFAPRNHVHFKYGLFDYSCELPGCDSHYKMIYSHYPEWPGPYYVGCPSATNPSRCSP